MTLYLTKSMLSKLNTVKYACNSATEEECNSGNSNDHWQKIYLQSDRGVELAKDMICRVCARSGSTPLLSKLTEDYDVLSAIRTISNLSISVSDSLPKYICAECLEMLRIALQFKRTCETSDRKFRNILNPMGDPSIHSYPYSKHDFHLILHQMKLKRMKIEEKKERQRQRVEKMFKKKNGPKEKQFKCSPCDLTFPDKDKLSQHRRERQCMRRACDICGQLVLSISQHRRHIHKQSQPHRCPTCGKEFPIIARLKAHMLVHTNTFNFFCDICPYKCKHKYYLVMHMRTHTGEKPYKCSQCPATFVNPSNLNKHKLTHQEKQIKCALCDKAFRTNPALREHHEAAHMNIKHTCNYCGRDFCYKSDLRKHEIRSHNRTKRDYIGGEPTYKQVERMKLQDNAEEEKWSMATTLTHARTKHDYIDDVSEETSERIHKLQDNNEEEQKWRQQHLVVTSHVPQTATLAQQFTVEDGKEYIYFSDVTGLIQPPQAQLVQQQTPQQTVTILPELLVKKDEVKLYEPQQGIGYF